MTRLGREVATGQTSHRGRARASRVHRSQGVLMPALARFLRSCLGTPAALLTITLLNVLISSPTAAFAAESPRIRLYTLDGGTLDFKDMSSFSDTGDYDGKAGKVA